MEQQRDGGGRGVGEALAYIAMGRQAGGPGGTGQAGQQYSTEAAYQIAEVYAFRGEIDRAFTGWRKLIASTTPGWRH